MSSGTDDPPTCDPPERPGPLTSVALTRCLNQHGRFDHLDVVAVPVPDDASEDPAWYASRAFSSTTLPRWVMALLALRQALVPLIGLAPSPRDTMRMQEVVSGEALIQASEKHLDFWLAIAVDPHGRNAPRLLRATTVVKLHRWRGRLYWSVIRHLHGPVTTAVLKRAVTGRRGRRRPPERSGE